MKLSEEIKHWWTAATLGPNDGINYAGWADRAAALEAELTETHEKANRERIRTYGLLSKLEAEVARLKADLRVEVENHEATMATVDRVLTERDALKAMYDGMQKELTLAIQNQLALKADNTVKARANTQLIEQLAEAYAQEERLRKLLESK